MGIVAGVYDTPATLKDLHKQQRKRLANYFGALRDTIAAGQIDEARDAAKMIEQKVNRLLEDALFLETQLVKAKSK